jgi:hypothetical protein
LWANPNPSWAAQAARVPVAATDRALDCEGQTIWIADAHCGDRKRFVVHADEKLTAFVELESAIRAALSVQLSFLTKFRLLATQFAPQGN